MTIMPLPKILFLFQAALFGLIVGSFLNVCIYRIPLKLSLLGRSFCPQCKAMIPFYRNVPVLAYLIQGGKSACCQRPIAFQYPAIELLTGALSMATFLHTTRIATDVPTFFTHYFAWFLLFVCPLIVISIIDFQLRIIPDVISIPFIAVGVLVQIIEHLFRAYPELSFLPVFEALKFSGLGILVGGGTLLLLAEVFSRLKGTDAMGGGDIKLAAMLGAFLGWRSLIFIFFASSIFALFYVVLRIIITRSRGDNMLPFGPFLSMGALVFYLYGREITDWYFAMNGIPMNLFFP